MKLCDPDTIFQQLPKLEDSEYEVTSDCTNRYNCISFSADDKKNRWWPNAIGYYWPSGIPDDEDIDSFVAMFTHLGYEECKDGSPEDNWEKVALYAKDNKPRHAAIQKARWGQKWRSKLGPDADIQHELSALEDGIYGKVIKYFRRRTRVS